MLCACALWRKLTSGTPLARYIMQTEMAFHRWITRCINFLFYVCGDVNFAPEALQPNRMSWVQVCEHNLRLFTSSSFRINSIIFTSFIDAHFQMVRIEFHKSLLTYSSCHVYKTRGGTRVVKGNVAARVRQSKIDRYLVCFVHHYFLSLPTWKMFLLL